MDDFYDISGFKRHTAPTSRLIK